MTVSAVKIIQPGEIQGMPDDDTPLLVLADAKSLFTDRAARLDQLSVREQGSPWLEFCAQLSRAQADSLNLVDSTPVSEHVVRESFKHHMPPLSISSAQPGQNFTSVLSSICKSIKQVNSSEKVLQAVEGLLKLAPQDQMAQAHAMLEADDAKVTVEYAPFIGAALQVIWTVRARQLESLVSLHHGESGLCPVCGSHPVASTIRMGDRSGHRYLNCSLCNAEWYAPRARCTNCDTPKEVSMFGRTRDDAVQGECCDDCKGYLKLMLQSKDPLIDAMADDLATYSLDVALADEGYMRTCRNLFFIS